jgi:hypothetical protein
MQLYSLFTHKQHRKWRDASPSQHFFTFNNSLRPAKTCHPSLKILHSNQRQPRSKASVILIIVIHTSQCNMAVHDSRIAVHRRSAIWHKRHAPVAANASGWIVRGLEHAIAGVAIQVSVRADKRISTRVIVLACAARKRYRPLDPPNEVCCVCGSDCLDCSSGEVSSDMQRRSTLVDESATCTPSGELELTVNDLLFSNANCVVHQPMLLYHVAKMNKLLAQPFQSLCAHDGLRFPRLLSTA